MCGVAGIKRTGPILGEDIERIQSYVEQLRSRGPDNLNACEVCPSVVLGSARLRITDALNERADMPLFAADGQTSIVFNGQIYNHKELRRTLRHYEFRTQSDTETLLAAYSQWGEALLEHVEGMFAFCICDHATQSLFLAVDPLGQKPLYYTSSKESFRFASELTPLLTDRDFSHSWNTEALSELICQRMIVGSDTHIREIRKLDGGCFLRVDRDNRAELQRYFYLDLATHVSTEGEASEYIRDAFSSSLLSMSELEVAGGVFLSGGLDSSSVLAGLHSLDKNLPTFTIGFEPINETPTFSSTIVNDEFEYTASLSELMETSNEREILNADSFFTHWDAWTDLMDEPLCFNETAAHLRLFERASDSCRVIYSGSGADELFDGYGFGASLTKKGIPTTEVASQYYETFNYGFGCDYTRLLLSKNTRERVTKKLNTYLSPYLESSDSSLQIAQALMTHARLPHSEFKQLDRASMAHSVEARLPFANKRFIEAAFAISPELKHVNGTSKYILRKAVQNLLPSFITERPKVPFAPIGQLFFTTQFEKRLKELFSPEAPLLQLGIVNSDYVTELFNSQLPEARPALTNLLLVNRVLSRQASFINNQWEMQ